MLSQAVIREVAGEHGFSHVGAMDLASFEREMHPHLGYLSSWQAKGFAGQMSYMNRPVELFGNLAQFLPAVRSIISFAVPYLKGAILTVPPGFGKVARYAWGRDYHEVIRERLQRCAERFEAICPGLRWRVFTDAVPLLERAIGSAARLGFVGKNSLLIRPGLGSYFFLGELLLSEEVEPFQPEQQSRGVSGRLAQIENDSLPGTGCHVCTRCLTSCPTDAIPQAGIIDAPRCISYLTIEKRGEFSEWERCAVGDWIFGCDVCQEVCPFNANCDADILAEFDAANGVGPFLSLEKVLAITSKGEFDFIFQGTALRRAKREGLVRNACAVAANTRCFELVKALSRLIKDVSLVVRSSAYGALCDLRVESDGLDRVRIDAALRSFEPSLEPK